MHLDDELVAVWLVLVKVAQKLLRWDVTAIMMGEPKAAPVHGDRTR